MVVITHKKVSGKSDGTDSTKVQASNWNDPHAINEILTSPVNKF
jgi:hypothetical protein